MDIRDITEEAIYPGSRTFEELFRLQLVLVDHYTKIESLPDYPIDINTKSGQDLVKDFSGRIIEELGEGFESYLLMLDMFHRGAPESEMIPHLQNFNEEISDALHFWLELMIFSGYTTRNIQEWFQADSQVGLLELCLQAGRDTNQKETEGKRFPGRWVIKDHQLEDEFLRGGRLLSIDRRDKMKQLLWDITYHLQIARNTLKNKPWKQTGMLTDKNQYELHMAYATGELFKFMAFTGFSPESIYTIYFKKNLVNQFRIKSKY